MKKLPSTSKIQPRFIRRRDASAYLGMDRNRFDSEVRPYLVEIPIGIQGVAFDRHDLDAWADHYKKRCGRQPQKKYEGDTCESEKVDLASIGETESGTLRTARELLVKARDLKRANAYKTSTSRKARDQLKKLRKDDKK
ncbi:MAG: hypothetical protein KZQ96_23015 [Candidatus Thiodiazotropha sp. (ex Lucinoma borealis)]|nr:hypothetical protein [Candidatus Thiodiazotropha sp. (ex Lucinoma borealis)]